MTDPDRLHDLLARYLSKEATPEELEELQALARADKGIQARIKTTEARWNRLEDEYLPGFDIERVRHTVIRRLSRLDPGNFGKQKTLHFPPFLKWAAVVLIVCLAGVALFITSRNTSSDMIAQHQPVLHFSTKPGERKRFMLPDSSGVWLNAGSRLIWLSRPGDTLRKLSLQGQAFFEVARNARRPFVVHAGDLIVRVTGTSFDIKSYQDEMQKVTVATGEVRVQARHLNRHIVLKPDEQVDANLDKKEVDALEGLSWTRGELVFDQAPLKEVTATLQRWYAVKIRIEDAVLNEREVTLRIKEDRLESVMEALSFVVDFDYQLKPEKDEVIITPKKP